nr:immunoglobulin light chain junction region [Macaca mulatta]
CQHGYGVPYRF